MKCSYMYCMYEFVGGSVCVRASVWEEGEEEALLTTSDSWNLC